MTLHILIGGYVSLTAPYDPDDYAKTAGVLRRHLPILRQIGRVAVFVTDGNVAHLIVRE